MARIRTIKPEFFDDEDIAAMSFPARLTFIGLWLQADREGRLKDRPVRLKARILPFDQVNFDDVLEEIARHRFIQRYVVNGVRYIAIRSFPKHQSIPPREPESALPEPTAEESTTGTVATLLEHCLITGEGKGREGKGTGTEDSLPLCGTPSSAVLVYRTVGTIPTWTLTEAQVAKWQIAYPALDIAAECRLADTWLEANPNRRKTAAGMPKFLVSWFNRSNDRGGSARQIAAVPARPAWTCPHVERCANRAQCDQASILGRARKAAAS